MAATDPIAPSGLALFCPAMSGADPCTGSYKPAQAPEGFRSPIDADGSMDPAEIESYVRAVNEGYDLVKGSRATGGSTDLTPTRLLGNFCLRGLVNLLYSADFTELCYGFMALRRTSVPAMELASDGFEIETEIVVNSLRRGLRIAEIPSHESERLNGVSHLHPVRDGLRVLSTIVRARFSRPEPDGIGTATLAPDSLT